MTQHYQKNTVSVQEWCGKCYRFTEHNVYGGKLGPCAICLKKLNDDHDKRAAEPKPAEQGKLF